MIIIIFRLLYFLLTLMQRNLLDIIVFRIEGTDTFILATFVVFSAIAWAAGAAAKKLQSPAFSLWLNRGSAVLFLALAVFTVFS